MQISECFHLTKWIKDEIENAQIVVKFDALFNILNTNSRRQNNQVAQPFEDQKNDLLEAITSVNINVLTLSQIDALELLEINQNIGNHGKSKILAILANTLDVAHVAAQVNTMKNEIQQGINKSNQLHLALEPIIDDEEPEIIQDHVLTRVMFEHDAAVRNIKELNDWITKWFHIGRGFAMANGQAPEDVQVIGGARGSLIIELALLATTALPIAKAINITLDSMVKFKDYQHRAIEVRRLKEDSPNLEKEFEEDAKRWEKRSQQLKKEVADNVTEEVKQYFSDYKEENQAEYGKAVKFLVDFITKGGDVDCVIAEESDEEEQGTTEEVMETLRLLRSDFSHIRELKETLLLEHKDDNAE
jgi:hypothetical protein